MCTRWISLDMGPWGMHNTASMGFLPKKSTIIEIISQTKIEGHSTESLANILASKVSQ